MAESSHVRPALLLLALISLSGCVPAGRPEPKPAPVRPTPARPAPVRPAPVTPPPSAAPAPVAPPVAVTPLPRTIPTAPAPQAPAWVAKPVTANAQSVTGRTYIVKPGDTLHGIIRSTGAPLDAVIQENGLSPPYNIRAGQKLKIPGGRYHLVRSGESGIAIARAYGIAWKRIAELNHLTEPYVLREGQKLLLPSQQEAANMTLEQRAEAFKLNIEDIVTGGEPALATNEAPAAPVTTPERQPPATTAIAAPSEKFDRRFVWPVEGRIVRPFGPLANGARNDGINIAAAQGTPIYAAADGIVAYVGTDVAIYGGLILIRHGDGWLTAYGHAERLQVARGQAVKKGQLIGYVAEAGLADQDQLHFEVRQGRTPVDPRIYLPKRG